MIPETSSPFEKFLKSSGIPYLPPRRSEPQDRDYCFALLTTLYHSFGLLQETGEQETLERFLFSQAVKVGTSIDKAAMQLWRFYRGLQSFQSLHYEFSLILQLLDGPLTQDDFQFYMKCKRLLVKSQLGDNPDAGVINLEDLVVEIQECVPILTQVFAGTFSPTASVQRLSQRLMDTEFTEEIPTSVLLKCCMAEYEEVKSRKKDAPKVASHRGHKPKCQSLDQLFYRNPGRLFESSLPVSSVLPKKPSPPSNFNLMNYGKSPFQETKTKPRESLKQTNAMFYDEELSQARVEEKTETRVKVENCPVKFNGFRGSVSLEMDSVENEKLKDEVDRLNSEKRQNQAAVEELMAFCQRVSTQHDMLLVQNSKLKRLLSLVTDKLIRVDPKLIKDIDFSEVINDPCRDFKALNSPSDDSPAEDDEEISVKDMPFSISAGKQIRRRTADD